ncbi:MAG: AAA family ATPase [Thermaurantimonas sp.]
MIHLQALHLHKYYFPSRPRRFGKSFLFSAIKYPFRGRRDLFEGLFIFDR